MNEPSKPPDEGLSRRSLLRRGGALAATAGIGAALAGCENTTTPVAANGAAGGGGKGILGDPTAGGLVDSAGIPLARRDYPVVLPKLGDIVASSAKPERGGELQIYNYADYVNPAILKAFGKREGVSVRVTTFDTLDEAFSKLSTGRLQFDVIFSTPDQLSRLVGRKLIQPLNFELIPNLQKNVWPELHSPFYDVGPRYSAPYTTYTTGIAWRNDVLDFDPSKLEQPWDAFWSPQAEKYRGKVAILDDSREAPGMALMRRGVTDLNTEDPELLQRAGSDLEQLNGKVGVKVSIADYETVPAGRVVLHQGWSGDMIAGVISYMPKGVKPDVLSYWYQAQGGPIFNDCICVAANAAKPVIAHRFLNYILDNKVAYENFAGYVGYQPPITAIDGGKLFEQGILPKTLSQAVVTREAFANGNAYLTLSAKGLQLWDRTWTSFRNG
ncbi:MAG TPA: spermidine/putrescine ABC transporter substrate-binding protein [Solirubrobacteraceae bacterium]|nr:spermidine/putrescine ABC transporter substrate-binding protein [Solirubrobacteraceae bacterium]